MSRPTVFEYNMETNTEIFREMNDEEYAQYLIDTAPKEPTNE